MRADVRRGWHAKPACTTPSLTTKLTTTNGTKAINMAKDKSTVVVGALNNLDALCAWLIQQERDVLVLGSGWKDKFNLEDTICGGAIADLCLASGKFYADEDSTVAAKFLFRSSRDNMFSFLKASSHRAFAQIESE